MDFYVIFVIIYRSECWRISPQMISTLEAVEIKDIKNVMDATCKQRRILKENRDKKAYLFSELLILR